MEADTMSLRKGAPQWSLAGDKQLLGMLEKIHQVLYFCLHHAVCILKGRTLVLQVHFL